MLIAFSATWIICGVVTAIIAGSRNRNAIGWFFIGSVLGIFGLILVIALPPATVAKPVEYASTASSGAMLRRMNHGETMQCPDCRSQTSTAQPKCAFCGFDLP